MMDYQQIKLDDPGGPVETALAALKTMTKTEPMTQNRIDLRDIYNACGSADGELVISALETAAQSNPVIARALAWAQPGEDMGIDICDAEVQAVFNSLVGGSVTQVMVDKVIGLSSQTVIKYPGIRAGDLEYARGLV